MPNFRDDIGRPSQEYSIQWFFVLLKWDKCDIPTTPTAGCQGKRRFGCLGGKGMDMLVGRVTVQNTSTKVP